MLQDDVRLHSKAQHAHLCAMLNIFFVDCLCFNYCASLAIGLNETIYKLNKKLWKAVPSCSPMHLLHNGYTTAAHTSHLYQGRPRIVQATS